MRQRFDQRRVRVTDKRAIDGLTGLQFGFGAVGFHSSNLNGLRINRKKPERCGPSLDKNGDLFDGCQCRVSRPSNFGGLQTLTQASSVLG